MTLSYKTLFEVKLMHEYYITDLDGNTSFDEPDQGKRLKFLLDAFTSERESISKDLRYAFPEVIKKAEDVNHIKLVPTYSGFRVVTRVNQHKMSDSSILFEPYLPLSEDLSICIQLFRNNNSIDQYTNSRISRPLPAIYFFSNESLPSDKTFPYITNAVASRTWGYNYEQGELAVIGTDLVEFYKDINGTNYWRTVNGFQFANEADRMLLPLRFNYSFDANSNVTNAEFVLKDIGGNEVKKIVFDGSVFLTSVSLDFSNAVLSLPLGQNSSLRNCLYFLQVTGDNNYQFNATLLFSNELYDRTVWGVVYIRKTVSNLQFNLVGTDGFLLSRKDKNGTRIDAPILEVPIKSRLGYWRYKNNHGDKLDLVPELTGYLFNNNGFLQTKTPRPVANAYFLLSSDIAVEKKYLPNPVNYNPVTDDTGRLCFDIKVPECDLFPVIP